MDSLSRIYERLHLGLDISIYYRDSVSGDNVDIDLRYEYSTLGGIDQSLHYWSLPRIHEIGIELLAALGTGSPIFICGWIDLERLGTELKLLSNHLDSIDYDPRCKASWLANLFYCYHVLRETAPKTSVPYIMIG